jgi:hypothetical protein
MVAAARAVTPTDLPTSTTSPVRRLHRQNRRHRFLHRRVGRSIAGTPEAKPVISTTTEILRRQPDGGWVHILDDPFFG